MILKRNELNIEQLSPTGLHSIGLNSRLGMRPNPQEGSLNTSYNTNNHRCSTAGSKFNDHHHKNAIEMSTPDEITTVVIGGLHWLGSLQAWVGIGIGQNNKTGLHFKWADFLTEFIKMDQWMSSPNYLQYYLLLLLLYGVAVKWTHISFSYTDIITIHPNFESEAVN